VRIPHVGHQVDRLIAMPPSSHDHDIRPTGSKRPAHVDAVDIRETEIQDDRSVSLGLLQRRLAFADHRT
jgi:hypothetical protein